MNCSSLRRSVIFEATLTVLNAPATIFLCASDPLDRTNLLKGAKPSSSAAFMVSSSSIWMTNIRRPLVSTSTWPTTSLICSLVSGTFGSMRRSAACAAGAAAGAAGAAAGGAGRWPTCTLTMPTSAGSGRATPAGIPPAPPSAGANFPPGPRTLWKLFSGAGAGSLERPVAGEGFLASLTLSPTLGTTSPMYTR